jgi:hypothetical protein
MTVSALARPDAKALSFALDIADLSIELEGGARTERR